MDSAGIVMYKQVCLCTYICNNINQRKGGHQFEGVGALVRRGKEKGGMMYLYFNLKVPSKN